MNSFKVVDFELIDLQYHWCNLSGSTPQMKWRNIYGNIAHISASGVIGGLVGGLIAGCFYGLYKGIALGVIIFLLLSSMLSNRHKKSINLKIETKDSINWSLTLFIKRLPGILFGALMAGGLYGYLFGFLFTESDNSIISIAIGIVVGIIFGLSDQLKNTQSYLKITQPYQRFYASMWSLHFSILQHFHLRRILYKRDLLPWRLVDFLNEATKNNILESDGGSWRFRHRILQDYFADYWEGKYSETEDSTLKKEG